MVIFVLTLISCIFIILPTFRRSKSGFVLSLKVAPLAIVLITIISNICRKIFFILGKDYINNFDFIIFLSVFIVGYFVVRNIAKRQTIRVVFLPYFFNFIVMIVLSIVVHIGTFFYKLNHISDQYKDINVGDNFSLEYKRLESLCFECDYRIAFKSGKKIDIMSNPAGLDYFNVYKLNDDVFFIKSVDFYLDVIYKIDTNKETVKRIDSIENVGDFIGIIKNNRYRKS